MLDKFKNFWMRVTGVQSAYQAGLDDGRAQARANLAIEAARKAKDKAKAGAWRERWYGSPPELGWSIVSDDGPIVHLGVGVQSAAVSEIVYQHNNAMDRMACGK